MPTKYGSPSSSSSKPPGKENDTEEAMPHFTRFKSDAYNNKLCFFCQDLDEESKLRPLHKLRTGKTAVEKRENEQFKVQLNTAIDPNNAHAIDIRYHLQCLVEHVQCCAEGESSTTLLEPINKCCQGSS